MSGETCQNEASRVHDWKIVLMLLGSVERRLNLKLRLQMSGCLATLNVGSSVERLGRLG